jgi:hypothetical protein
MAIKRYKADADNTIASTYQANLVTRGTGANVGRADVLETFSIYGRQASSSQELSRILIKFPMSGITTDRTAGSIPASGSVSFYLRLYNAKTSKTVPNDFKLIVRAVSRSWQEGDGLDLEDYRDLTNGSTGSNWINAASASAWTRVGGDYLTGASEPLFTQSFSTGLEDLEIDVSSLVEQWIAGTYSNYGVGIFLTSSEEAYYSGSNDDGQNPPTGDSGSVLDMTTGTKTSYYTKRFFARGTQYFFKKPVIEARWNSVRRDDRGDFYYSSSLAPAADNSNTLYLYNYVRGRLRNIPGVGTGKISLSFYSGSADNTGPSGSKLKLSITDDGKGGGVIAAADTNATGGWYSTGIYTCSLAVTSSSQDTAPTILYDVWHSASTRYFTGSTTTHAFTGMAQAREPIYYLNITNLRDKYNSDETARFNLYVRNKYWNPTIYTKASVNAPNTSIVSASYRVVRVIDAYDALPYGTGSDFQTGLSYDVSGNYFDLDMKLLDPGYAYAIKFAFYDPELATWTEQRGMFKFRVEDYEY